MSSKSEIMLSKRKAGQHPSYAVCRIQSRLLFEIRARQNIPMGTRTQSLIQTNFFCLFAGFLWVTFRKSQAAKWSSFFIQPKEILSMVKKTLLLIRGKSEVLASVKKKCNYFRLFQYLFFSVLKSWSARVRKCSHIVWNEELIVVLVRS